jgi:hypothetical protein
MKRFASVVLVLCVAAAVPAAASTFIRMTTREMLAESAAVVDGEVLSVSSFWDEAGIIIVTEAVVLVREAVVGDTPGAVTVRTWGGTVGGYTIEAHGFPEFRVGERLLLFVGDEKDGWARVVGYRQGQYRIGQDRTGAEVAIPTYEAHEAAMVTPDGREGAPPRPYRLAAFKDHLRAEAARVTRHAN